MKKLRKFQAPLIVIAVLFVVITGTYLFLLSEYSMRNLWFPLAEEKTGIKLSAERCSVSLFTSKTFTAKKLKITAADYSVTADTAEISTSPFKLLFDRELQVHSVLLDGIRVNLLQSAAAEQKPAETPRKKASSGSVPVNETSAQEVSDPLKFTVKNITIRNLKTEFTGANGEKISISKGNLSLDQLSPGKESTVEVSGILQGNFKTVQLKNSDLAALIRFRFPMQGFLPESFSVKMLAVRTSLSAGKFHSENNELTLNANLDWKEGQIILKQCLLNIFTEKEQELLSARLNGTIASSMENGTVSGQIKLTPSPLTDAILYDLSGAKLNGFSSVCNFKGTLQQKNITADLSLDLSADQAIPVKEMQNQPLLKPQISLKTNVTGSTDDLSFRINNAAFSFRQQNKLLCDINLLSPWQALKAGEVQFSPLPHFNAKMDQFPLSILTPFGIDPQYAGGTVSLSVTARSGAKKNLLLTVDGATGFPVAEIGTLSLHAELDCNEKEFVLKNSKISLGAGKTSVSAQLNGMFSPKPLIAELDAALIVRNPEKVFRQEVFRGIDEIKPRFTAKALVNGKQLDLWLEAAGGKYRLNLITKASASDSNAGYQTDGTVSALQIRAGETELLNLPYTFRIPTDFSVNGMEFSASAKTVSPQLFREIAFLIPKNLSFDNAKTIFSLSASCKENIWNAALDLSQKQLLLRNWEPQKNAGLNYLLSLRAAVDKNTVSVQKCEFETSVNGGKTAHVNLNGTAALRTPGTYIFNLDSKWIDAKVIEKLAEKLTVPPKQQKQQTVQTPAPAVGQKRSAPVKKQGMPLIDLSPYSGSVLNFNLQNFSYTKDFVLNWKGTASVSGPRFALNTHSLNINQKPGQINLSIDPSKPDYLYNIGIKLNDLPVSPVIRAVCGGTDHGISAQIKTLDLSLRGTGLTPDRIKQNINGSFNTEINDLVVNIKQVSDSQIVKVLLVLVRSIAPLAQKYSEIFPGTNAENLIQTSRTAEEILTGQKDLAFQNVIGKISFNNGNAKLKQLVLKDGFLKMVTLSGTLNMPTGKIKLETSIKAGNYEIPFHIKGTLDKFQLEISKTQISLIEKNLNELTKPVKKAIDKFKSLRDLIKSRRK